jgi:hypothetical protein
VGVNALTGRGTRVWTARTLLNGSPSGDEVVIKDCWLNDDRPMEHDTLRAVTGDLEKRRDPRRRHFLTYLHAGLVPVHDGQVFVHDHTVQVIRRGRQLVATIKVVGPPSRTDTPITRKSGSYTSKGVLPNVSVLSGGGYCAPGELPDINVYPRHHYRIVFAEVGTVFRELSTYDKAFFTLQGAVCGEYVFLYCKTLSDVTFLPGLSALHSLGKEHRDVSANNALLVERKYFDTTTCEEPVSGQICKSCTTLPSSSDTELVGVIMDLEFAVDISDNVSRHDVRTVSFLFLVWLLSHYSIIIQGTKHFVATEVAHGDWQIDDSVLPDTEGWLAPPFRQHVFHDLEPMYWAAVYFLFNFHPPNTPTPPLFETAYSQFFPNTNERDNVWLFTHTAEKYLRLGLPTVLHRCIGPLKKWQHALRALKSSAYATAVPNLSTVTIAKSAPRAAGVCLEGLIALRGAISNNPDLQRGLVHARHLLAADEGVKGRDRQQ